MTCGNCGESGHRRDKCTNESSKRAGLSLPLPDPCNICGKPRRLHPPRGCPTVTTSDVKPPSRFAEAMAASAAQEAAPQVAVVATVAHAPVKATASPPPNEHADRWSKALDQAATYGPGLLGALLWVERRCVDGKLHPMDPAWMRHFDGFYESRKFIDIGRFGVRAAKSDSVCRAIVAESLLNQRKLEPSIVGVCPVMSANMREAGDRFDTVKAILRACGLQDLAGTRGPADEKGFKTSGGGNAALVIELYDSQAHPIEFRIYPASEAGAAGFTGIAGFGDELDLWGKSGGANPASKVLRVLRSRYTTQPEAKLHLMSATYDRESEHAAMIEKGDTPGQYVARLGEMGAAKDHAERMRLAAKLRSTDATLCAPPLPPDCADIPCWVTNPITPIEEAYAKADGNLLEMFALYGGRLALAGGAGDVDQIAGLAAMNRQLVGDVGRSWRDAAGVPREHGDLMPPGFGGGYTGGGGMSL